MPKVKPGTVHGITITMHEEVADVYNETKRWDATRAHPPAVSVGRMQKMVKEDTRNALRTEKLHAKAGTPMWDVGERPNVPMPFLEYPVAPAPPVALRSELDFAAAAPPSLARHDARRAHQEAVRAAGWGSPCTSAYVPLGAMDDLTGEHVHPSRFTNGLVRLGGLKLIEPMAGHEDDSLEEHKRIVPGDSYEDYVRKGEYVYYSIEVPAGRALEVTLTALTGDPDLYIDCRHPYPTHASHGWRANMLGNDVVRIEPDDPIARPGVYYIGVLGVKKDSRYVIDTQLEQKLVDPPSLPQHTPSQGFALISRELHHAGERKGRVANGASLLHHLPAELSRGGHAYADVKAVADEVGKQLHDLMKASSGGKQHEVIRKLGKGVPAQHKRPVARTPPDHEEKLQWQPPPGMDWSDLPDGTRMIQALRDYRVSKVDMDEKLEQTLMSMAVQRPLKYAIRMKAISALDPTSTLSHPSTLRRTTEVVEHKYSRAKGASSLPQLKSHTPGQSQHASRPTTSSAPEEGDALSPGLRRTMSGVARPSDAGASPRGACREDAPALPAGREGGQVSATRACAKILEDTMQATQVPMYRSRSNKSMLSTSGHRGSTLGSRLG
ncbi:hypothetical protein AB1Y20_003944 [Prymnesium parvum]|uniref:Peptidase C2 calpain domain-containing protein n=1 Tax=Prymnesium parvum TaxID=97485 RepID=A0AB34J8Q3_PRYPA